VLVNNAGQGLQAPIEEIKIEDYRELLNLIWLRPDDDASVVPLMREQAPAAS